MHLLETRHQRDYADASYPHGLVRHLRDLGILSPRLTLAHCVWARDDELALIADADATIAVNTSSNLQLRSGVAPVARMRARGCRVALGVDGCALDDDDDAVRELRLAGMLHAEPGIDGGWQRSELLRAATAHGRRTVGVPGNGALVGGALADWLSLDVSSLDRDAVGTVTPWSLLMARGNKGHIAELVVAGEVIVRDGYCVSVDRDAVHADLRQRFRRAAEERADLRDVWARLSPAIADFYRGRVGCC